MTSIMPFSFVDLYKHVSKESPKLVKKQTDKFMKQCIIKHESQSDKENNEESDKENNEENYVVIPKCAPNSRQYQFIL